MACASRIAARVSALGIFQFQRDRLIGNDPLVEKAHSISRRETDRLQHCIALGFKILVHSDVQHQLCPMRAMYLN